MLNAMRPAVASSAVAAPVHRVAVVYVPNGIVMKDWLPVETGTDFTFPRILKPLESFRDHITVISGLENTVATRAKGGGHAKASGSFLSGMPPKYTAGADVRAGVTFDQVAASKCQQEEHTHKDSDTQITKAAASVDAPAPIAAVKSASGSWVVT